MSTFRHRTLDLNRTNSAILPALFLAKLVTIVFTNALAWTVTCLLYTSPSPRDRTRSRMPSSA